MNWRGERGQRSKWAGGFVCGLWGKQRSIEVAVLKLWEGSERARVRGAKSSGKRESAKQAQTHTNTHTHAQPRMHWLTVRRKWKCTPRTTPHLGKIRRKNKRRKNCWLPLSPTCYTILECGERGRSFWVSVKWKEIVAHQDVGEHGYGDVDGHGLGLW